MRRFLLAVPLVAIAGCNHHNNPEMHLKSVPMTLPAGWQQTTSENGKVSLGVAPGWHAGVEKTADILGGMSMGDSGSADPTAANPDATKLLGKIGEEFAAQEKEQQKAALEALKKKGIIIQVLDGSKPTPGEARTRYFVMESHADWFFSLDEAVEIEKPRFFANVKPTKVTLPIGDAMRMEETRTLRDGGVLTVISYLVVNGHDMYSLRFTTESQGTPLKDIADQVSKTLRVKS